ncbi:DUF4382 domain-containing protein [Cochleicola gelatinilyticus]|uniref:Carbohydrate-binding protein n=1 Tax=Cochleicola gelatinilyticus TaxID=1763537 RepID=A0A167J7T4_9FLAO|nr:DUF4382 domain-containing protein [Cochleicola gelatinilyticus]OAB80407.1 carbohydrate-binding protein [Cochleicola gelatinilyticus]
MKFFLKSLVLLTLFVGLVSCSDDDSTTQNAENGTARMAIKLTDNPGDYDAVFVDVENVVVKYNGEEDEVFFTDINAGIYDLLELTGGVSVLLVDEEIPAGDISQIRLILGDDNTIVVDGETFSLDTPSAQQSGLKIQVNETLEDGIFYEFVLDFDVDRSILQQGNGQYKLKPVIRATTVAETGAIAGNVLPLGIQTMVTAENGVDTISAYTNDVGAFLLSGVPEGVYTVTYEADIDLDLPVIVVENVSVSTGATTSLETVEF